MKNVRFTVTLDEENFKKLENEKKKRRSNRSSVIREMIQYFFEKKNEEAKIRKYINGYQKNPEKINKVAELEKEQYKVLDDEF
jgi:metal-responsive CopG/Arc/MetJ family transcriptional regulator